MQRLEGLTALVTGASRGIGAAVARTLAAQGAQVAISYTANAAKADEVVASIREQGGEAIAFRADQAIETEVVKLVHDTVGYFGKLDILVNNAGVFSPGRIDDASGSEAWDNQFRINYLGVVTAIRAAAGTMRDGGRIISMSSGIANRVSMSGAADYCATKRAIEGFTKGAAYDLGSRGITVNAIAVGSIETDMNPADGPAADAQRASNALGRYGQPEEIAAMVAFLAGAEASFVTGAVLPVDGGYGA